MLQRMRLSGWLRGLMFIIAIAGILGALMHLRAAELVDTAKGVRVLVAGHSFCVPMTEPMSAIAKAAGFSAHKVVDTQYLGDSSVTQHWDLADRMNVAKQDIIAGKVDVLVLSPHTLIPDPAIQRFTELLLKYNPKARVYIYEAWLPYDGQQTAKDIASLHRNDRTEAELIKLQEPWCKALDEQVAKINAGYDRQVVYTIPTGKALFALRGKIHDGEIPAIKNEDELFTDPMGHPSNWVKILGAYCEFAAIYGKSPVDTPWPESFPKLDQKVIRQFQEIAWKAVTEDKTSGVKAK